eukprot:3359386-Rhodomonas_salina.2
MSGGRGGESVPSTPGPPQGPEDSTAMQLDPPAAPVVFSPGDLGSGSAAQDVSVRWQNRDPVLAHAIPRA